MGLVAPRQSSALASYSITVNMRRRGVLLALFCLLAGEERAGRRGHRPRRAQLVSGELEQHVTAARQHGAEPLVWVGRAEAAAAGEPGRRISGCLARSASQGAAGRRPVPPRQHALAARAAVGPGEASGAIRSCSTAN